MSIPDKRYEDFFVGQKFVTGTRVVPEEYIAQFAEISGDHNPIHTDPEAAKATPYGGVIAHGGLVLAMSTGLFINSDAGAPGVFLGLSLDYAAPTFPGDEIHLEVEVLSMRRTKRGDRGIVEYRVDTVRQNGDVVIKGVWKIMVYCREG